MALDTHIVQTTVDFEGLAALRRSASTDQKDQETLRQVAGQFEALFVNMMLKSMRQASLSKGIFDTSQSDTYREMADQQLAMDLSARGGLGLQDVILRQLGGDSENQYSTPGKDIQSYRADSVQARTQFKIVENPELVEQVIDSAPKSSVEKANAQARITFDSPEQFVQQLWPMAKQAAEKIGVPPEVILSQAALETGWGKHVINKRDGQSSHNLFNIKADSRWQGEFTTVGTTEYHRGAAIKEQAQFRSYESYQDSFNDYVDFLQTNPRYQQALKHADDPNAFIENLHKSGYATDPDYADKIKHIMNSSTLAQISQHLRYS